MEQRNKLWRHRQQWRLFKSRMILCAATQHWAWNEDGEFIQHPHWIDCAKQPWSYKYKTMRTPCSCALCKGERYNRIDYNNETQRIIDESFD